MVLVRLPVIRADARAVALGAMIAPHAAALIALFLHRLDPGFGVKEAGPPVMTVVDLGPIGAPAILAAAEAVAPGAAAKPSETMTASFARRAFRW